LQGQAEQIKERTLGIEVFRRGPDYDTTDDHVVRTAAGEVRRRLAQYYAQPEHQSEIRIELPLGSYIPKFQLSNTSPPALEKPVEIAPVANAVAPVPKPRIVGRRWPFAAIGLMVGALAMLTATQAHFGTTPSSALDRFWGPVLRSPTPVLISLGQGKVDA
jgi:hypothetical protein